MDLLKGVHLKCYGFSHYRFGAKSVKLLRDKLDVYRSGAAHKIYERISGYLVDGTPEEFSKSSSHHDALRALNQYEGSPWTPPPPDSSYADAALLFYRPFDAEVVQLLHHWTEAYRYGAAHGSAYDLGYAKKVSVDQPSLWVAQRNTLGLRIQVLDVTMSCRVHDSFSQCGRFSARPANFVTEHTRRAKNCVLIHGHNLSAAPAQRPHRPGQISPPE